jgi:hypothetical protein
MGDIHMYSGHKRYDDRYEFKLLGIVEGFMNTVTDDKWKNKFEPGNISTFYILCQPIVGAECGKVLQ